MFLLLAAACGPPGDGAVACGQLEPRNDDEIALCNDLDQAVIARVAVPEGDPPSAGWPGVVVLHGSGGLFLGDDGDSCTEELQEQFATWAEMLTSRGYAVLMPASFYSRGFCDWNESRTVPRKLDEDERLVVRTYDGAAAADWLCDDPRVDCSRLAVIGFSNGASTALMMLHEDLSDADDPRLRDLADEIPALSGGVAYYPGCGLQGELATSLDAEDIDRYYYPSAPLFVPHAERDSLLDDCEELRDPQVDVIAEQDGINEDRFDIEVYRDAEHGFDVWETGDPQPNLDARNDAQARALAKLDEWF
jgi:dienelactone hydrolase